MLINDRFKKVLTYIKPYIGLTILSFVISSIYAALNTAPALLVKNLINDVFISKDSAMLLKLCVLILSVTFGKGLTHYFRQYIQAYISLKIIKNLRNDLYNKLVFLSHDFFSKSKTGDLLTTFVSDINQVNNVLKLTFNLIVQAMNVIFLIGSLFYRDWKLTIAVIIILPLSNNIVRKYTKRLKKLGAGVQETLAVLNSHLQESISGIDVIKSFATEEYEEERFDEKCEDNFKIALKNRKIEARLQPIVEMFGAFAITSVMYYGGYQVVRGKLTAGDLISFVTALGLLSEPLKKVANNFGSIQSKLHSIDRIWKILESDKLIDISNSTQKLEDVKGEVLIKNLEFSYPGNNEKALKGINLEVKPGEMIALVGKSGSGKSTFVKLLPRFYDLLSGEIKIDGTNIKKFELSSLRKNIGIVPQETFLFSGTIYDNISYGSKDAIKEEIIEAAKMANAYEFIKELPDGFETEIGEKGVRLSGGQKQRIAIARALLENPKILILDEATSALDTESEKLVQEALDKLMKERTSFVIAHRLTTILHADKIVVLEDGEIKELGTNDELLALNGIYKTLYDTQFSNVM